MSSTTLSISTASEFQSILNNALQDYTKQTGVDLTMYDFANQLELCGPPDEVCMLLREKMKKFKEYRDGNRKLSQLITPVVQVVHVFARFLGEAASSHPASSPGKAIFAAVDVLLTAAMSVSSSYDALVDLFECVGNFLRRLSLLTEMPCTDEMMDILVRIMVEVLSVLALATKQIKQGRFKKFAKELFKAGGDIEAVLQRLDRLTADESRLTVTQTLQIVYCLVNNVKLVMDNGSASTDGIRQALVSMQETASLVNKMWRDQLQDKVRNWLSPPDPSTNQKTIYGSYQAGNASWLFYGNVFAEWKATGPILWITGEPGSGKSTLISSIIKDLDAKRAAGLASVVYYYFDVRDANKRNRQGLLSYLLVQLASESNPCYEILSRLYTTHCRGARKPTAVSLTHFLKDMLKQHRQATYIVIDAIDECPNTSGFPTPREKVLEFLEGLIDLQLPHLHVCIASRPEVDIRDRLEPLTPFRQRWFLFQNMGPSPSGGRGHVMASDGTRALMLGGLSSTSERADETAPFHVVDTRHIEYPKRDPNSVKPCGKTTQLVPESSEGPLPQPPTTSSSDAHAIHGPFQKVTPEELGRKPSSIGLASLLRGVNGKPRHVPKKVKFSAPGASSEGAVAQLEHERIVELERQLELAKANANVNATKAAKRVELELRKQADQILVQTSRVNQKDAELVSLQAKLDELLISRTQDARAVDQAQSALQKAKADADERSQRACKQIDQYETELAEVRAELQARKSELVKATSCAAEADEWSLRAYKQIGQYATELAGVRVEFQARKSELEKATFRAAEADERSQRASEQIEQYVKELAEVRTELDTKKSELEAVRLRLRDTENGWTKSKVQPETLNAPTAKSPNNMEDNMEEGQITCRLMERMQAMEAEIASLRWSEKSFERMECRNEG